MQHSPIVVCFLSAQQVSTGGAVTLGKNTANTLQAEHLLK